jgi:hypothetical protein
MREDDAWYPVRNTKKAPSRKRLVVTIEVDDLEPFTEVDEELLNGWVLRWPKFTSLGIKFQPEVMEIQEVYPCARCGFAATCKRIFGTDCHS